ncbi:hypothetical protein UFOVP182_10 [uncultured Caudovirales phage]|uniref:Uncharacterized protein n=1 Tax=uncultured Caudovirales phage TaxID=2100421 RepID=A0A6J7WKD3_9CAUD|nr:hypothetical protein UFOVP182_10 [uncultured Caudovirales phage]
MRLKYKLKDYQALTLDNLIHLMDIEENPDNYEIPVLEKVAIFSNTTVEDLEEYDIEKLKKLVKLFSNKKPNFEINRDMEIDGKMIYFRFRNEDLPAKTILDMKKMRLLEIVKYYFVAKDEELSDDWYLKNITLNEIMFLLEHYDLYRQEILKIIPEMLKNND